MSSIAKTLTPHSHPPLCPKTEQEFKEIFGMVVYREPVPENDDPLILLESHAVDRRFLARYQACAWQDRAERWDRVACEMENDDYQWRAAADELHRCEDIARAWREWEKEKA